MRLTKAGARGWELNSSNLEVELWVDGGRQGGALKNYDNPAPLALIPP